MTIKTIEKQKIKKVFRTVSEVNTHSENVMANQEEKKLEGKTGQNELDEQTHSIQNEKKSIGIYNGHYPCHVSCRYIEIKTSRNEEYFKTTSPFFSKQTLLDSIYQQNCAVEIRRKCPQLNSKSSQKEIKE